MSMAATSSSRFSILFIITVLLLHSSSSIVASNLDWMIPVRSVCRGTVAECMAAADGEEEFNLDSEINRRILANNRYVSYGALQKNNVPCSRRGASYYNCRSGGQANPYSRGCSTITRCER